ncbi:LysR family transcriptional regulator [Nocardia macrotermitis]|uniref:HTH-type transcriptional regulator CysL n=1 Tax=Nocardia macrotermitis TaxID=2585198 RepID=A0A7K0CXY2_9NOCA|nr:LysR family transcriptional regulator [Nocardia macrotermitis]MQY17504.1 HTH-type transcriptional regulator CysL [Nocardia macrotermitis]
MELRQIECFLACRESGSFTAAARSLNLVQSAVSTSVAKLERELGARLFDRTPRGLELTEAGRAIAGPAGSMVRARREITDAIAAAQGEVRGEVVIGNLMNIRSLDLAAVLADMHRRYPALTLQMRQSMAGMSGNIAGLLDGSLDIALLAGSTDEIPGLSLYPITEETVVLCVRPDHPLAGRRFPPEALAGVRFIDYPPGWGIRGIADDRFPLRRSVIEVADQEFALELAVQDFGVTMVPRSVAERQRDLVHIDPADGPIPWKLVVAHDAQRTPSHAARTVIETLRNLG